MKPGEEATIITSIQNILDECFNSIEKLKKIAHFNVKSKIFLKILRYIKFNFIEGRIKRIREIPFMLEISEFSLESYAKSIYY